MFGSNGYTNTIYTYTPYGEVTASSTVAQSPRGLGGGLDKPEGFAPQGRAADGAAVSQPIQWSSEFYDDELGLVYYNYRYYNFKDGKWLCKDPIHAHNLSTYVNNNPVTYFDYIGCQYCASSGFSKLSLPNYKGALNVPPYLSIDWDSGFDAELCLDIEKGEASGSINYSFEVGVTGGVIFKKHVWRYDIYGLIGVRIFGGIEGNGKISGTYDKKKCSWSISADIEGTIYAGGEVGAIARASNREGKLVAEIGIGGNISYSAKLGLTLSCEQNKCEFKGYLMLSDEIDYSLFANFGWFDLSYQDSIEVKQTEKKLFSTFPFPFGGKCK